MSPLGASGRHLRLEKARQSLNVLRASLNRSLNTPIIDDVSEEEQEEAAEVNEDDVSQLCEQLGGLHSALEADNDDNLHDDENNLDEPASSESPKFGGSIEKSSSESPLDLSEMKSKEEREVRRSSAQLKKLSPTDSLAASLQRGLQVIHYHKRKSNSEGSPVSFSFEHLITKSTEASASKSAALEAVEIIPQCTADPKVLLRL